MDLKLSEQIRGICALVVVVAHAWQVFIFPLGTTPLVMDVLAGLAVWAVATFFIISGLMIALSLEKRTRGGQFDFIAYMRARVLRIFPVLYLGVALTVVVVASIQFFDLYGAQGYKLPSDVVMTRDRATFGLDSLLLTLTLTYNLLPGQPLSFNGPLWSLSYEFWMYVLAGLLWHYRVKRVWWSITASMTLIVAMLSAPTNALPFWIIWLVWGGGFFAGIFWRHMQRVEPCYLMAAALAIGAIILLVGQNETIYYLRWAYGSSKARLIYICMSGTLLCGLMVLLRKPPIDGELGRWLTGLGAISYTLYVVHFPLMWLMLSCFRPSVLDFGFLGHAGLASSSIIVSLGFAALAARLVENRPLLNKWLPLPKW